MDTLLIVVVVIAVLFFAAWLYNRIRPPQGIENLKDRVVLITGAASGIGREMVKAFSAEGAHVVAVDVDASGLNTLAQEVSPRPLMIQQVDLQDFDALETMVARIKSDWKRIDVLVNNAAVSTGSAIDDVTPTPALISRMVNVNLGGAIHLTYLVLPLMQSLGGGMIVNVASMAAVIRQPMHDVYTATKSGLDGFSDVIRRKHARDGVKVVKVYPGLTYTPMIARSISYGDFEQWARTHKILAGGDKLYMPEEVASDVIRAVKRYEKEVLFGGPLTRIITALVRWFPFSMDGVLQSLLDKPKDKKSA